MTTPPAPPIDNYATILDSINDGVFTVDRQWRITSFNRAAERITGVARAEAIGRPCCEVFRASICESACALRHIGLYAYRVGFLLAYPTLERAPIEALESLEQLRALWHGYRIVVEVTDEQPPPGVDTPADLERVRRIVSGGHPN